ncbi:MAG: hypothetical protein ACREEM_10625 [Blastocatellia bacterium]
MVQTMGVSRKQIEQPSDRKQIMPSSLRYFLRQAGVTGASLLFSASFETGSAPDSRQENAITCRVVDAELGHETAARIRLLDARGRDVAPVGHPQILSEEAQEGDVRLLTCKQRNKYGNQKRPRNLGS